MEVNIELRKAKKDEQILKRRSISVVSLEKSPSRAEEKNVVSAGCLLPGGSVLQHMAGAEHPICSGTWAATTTSSPVTWVNSQRWIQGLGRDLGAAQPSSVLFCLEMCNAASLDGR